MKPDIQRKPLSTDSKVNRLKSPRIIQILTVLLVVACYVFVIRPFLAARMATVAIEMTISLIIILSVVVILAIILITLLITLFVSLLGRSGSRTTPWLKRLRGQSKLAAWLVAVLVIIVLGSQWLAYTPPILGSNGRPLPGSIAELEKTKLGGSNQWITIRGKSTKNPVLLFLAGGPGGSQLAATRAELKMLEEHFVVVNWDQPGSAKSYHAVSRKELTPERYISDAHELTQYLCERFNQDKIYVVGESWGSALGIMLVQRYPELYHAFMGTGQMVAFVETEKIDYEYAMKIAGENGDNDVVEKLKKQGPPPYYGSDVTWKSSTYLMYLSNLMAKNPSISDGGYNTLGELSGPEYGLYDKVNFLRGVVTTFNHVYPQLYDNDLRKEALKIKVPVYFLEGRHDVNAPISLAEEYYDAVEAPHKELIWFEHSGHDPWRNESERFVDTIVSIAQKNIK